MPCELCGGSRKICSLEHLKRVLIIEGLPTEKEIGCFCFDRDRTICPLEGEIRLGKDLFVSSECPLVRSSRFFYFADGSSIVCECKVPLPPLGTAIHIIEWNYVELQDCSESVWPISPYIEIVSFHADGSFKGSDYFPYLDDDRSRVERLGLNVKAKVLTKSSLYHPKISEPSFFVDAIIQEGDTDSFLITIVIIGRNAISSYSQWQEEETLSIRNVIKSQLKIPKTTEHGYTVLVFDDQSFIEENSIFSRFSDQLDSFCMKTPFNVEFDNSSKPEVFASNVSTLPFAFTMNYEGFITDYLYLDDPIQNHRMIIGYVLDHQYLWYIYHTVLFHGGRGWRQGAKLRLWHIHPLIRDQDIVGWVSCSRSSATLLEFGKLSRFSSPYLWFSSFLGLLSRFSFDDGSKIYYMATALFSRMIQRKSSQSMMINALDALVKILKFSTFERDFILESFEHSKNCVHNNISQLQKDSLRKIQFLREWIQIFKGKEDVSQDLFSKWKSSESLVSSGSGVAFVYLEHIEENTYLVDDTSTCTKLYLCSKNLSKKVPNGWYLIQKCLFIQFSYSDLKSETEIIVDSSQLLPLFVFDLETSNIISHPNIKNLGELLNYDSFNIRKTSTCSIIAQIKSRQKVLTRGEGDESLTTIILILADMKTIEITMNLYMDVERLESLKFLIPGTIVAFHRILHKRTHKGKFYLRLTSLSRVNLLGYADPSCQSHWTQSVSTLPLSNKSFPFIYLHQLHQKPDFSGSFRLAIKLVSIHKATFSVVCSICKSTFLGGTCSKSCHPLRIDSTYSISAYAQCFISDYSSEATLLIRDNLVMEFFGCSVSERQALCNLAIANGPLQYVARTTETEDTDVNNSEQSVYDGNILGTSTLLSLFLYRAEIDQTVPRPLYAVRPQSSGSFLRSTLCKYPIHTICSISRISETTSMASSAYEKLQIYSSQLNADSLTDAITIRKDLTALGFDRFRLQQLSNGSMWTINSLKMVLRLVSMADQSPAYISSL